MIQRRTLRCQTCGERTAVRTAIGHGEHQEFAFPCHGCGLEIRYGMNLVQAERKIEYVKMLNADWCEDDEAIKEIRTVDGETLNPVCGDHFSPFMATIWLPRDRKLFAQHQSIRQSAANMFWPQLGRLLTHLERKQWPLFDKQLEKSRLDLEVTSEADRIKAAFHALELNGRFFTPQEGEKQKQQVRQRISLAESISPPLARDLVGFFQAKQKDEALVRQLWSIRERWSKYHSFLAPIYNCFYWDDKKHSLDSFTLAQKRFEELKPFYVDCFETFCRISVVAAGLEGIIFQQAVGVPTTRRLITLGEFDVMPNGAKPAILKQLVVGDVFAPFIDSKLRNGIGHHSAHYDVKKDRIEYTVENDRRIQHLDIPYVRFCEKVVRLYAQLETVSTYAHWLRLRALGIS